MSTSADSDHDAQVAFEKKLKDEQRLCHMVKRPDFDGYGFNLHSEKGKPGQYIGKVDEKSPAEQSGLRQGDRIIEVNGVNIGSETHKQVVQRIKAIENEVRLLVIDPEIEQRLKQQHYQDVSMSSSSSSKTVESSTSSTASAATTTTMRNSNNNSHSSQASSPTTSLKTSTKQLNNNNDTNRTASPDHQMSSANGSGTKSSPLSAPKTSFDGNNTMSHSTTMQNGTTTSNGKSSSTKTTANSNAAAAVANPSVSGGLNLKMTAAEMRAKLQARKKYDPKNDSVDLRKKFDIIQKL